MEKYAKPNLKVVQTPWEAALNSGSASSAFVEEKSLSPYPTSTLTPSPAAQLYDPSQIGVYRQSPNPSSYTYNKSALKDDSNIYQPTIKNFQLEQVSNIIVFDLVILFIDIILKLIKI